VRVLGAGDNVVDRYDQLNLMFPGGNALNVAVYARRAGAQASYLGVLGDDEAGRHVLAALIAEDVGIERLRVESGPNAYSDILLSNGDRSFLAESEGVSRFVLDEDDLAYAETFDIVHTGYLGFLEPQVAEVAARVPVSFDLSTRDEPEYLASILPYVEVVFLSRSGISDARAERLAVHAHSHGPRVVVVTRGAGGSVGFDGQTLYHQPPMAISPVDTLGAGDAYIGRFLVEYVAGAELAVAMKEATKAATAVCGAYGAFGYGTRCRRARRPATEEQTGGS
jgi:fructoselysine 6-kinase